MESNAANVLGVMLRHLTGVQGAVRGLHHDFDRLKLVAVGALGAFAGFEVLKGIYHVINGSKQLNTELDRTVQLGGEFASHIEEIRKAAFQVSFEVGTSTPSGNVRLIRELGTQLSSRQDAMAILPHAAKLAWVLEQFSGRSSEQAIQEAVKVADLRGAIFARGPSGEERVDPNKLAAEMDAMAAGIRLSGGMLQPHDFLMFARQAGLAGKLMDPKAFYAMSAEAMIAMGPARTGTAMTSLFQQAIAGQMMQRVAVEWTKMGLLHMGEWHTAKGGHVILTDEAKKRLSAIAENPYDWINKTLVPQLESKGKKGQDLLMEVFSLFGRQTTQRLVAEIIQNQPQFERARRMFPEIMGVDDTWAFLNQHDLATNLKEVSSAWTGFIEALGTAGTPATIFILHALTAGLHELTRLIEAHPQAATWILEITAGLAGLMVGLGTWRLFEFLLVGSRIKGLTTALTGLSGATAAFTEGAAAATGLAFLVGTLLRLASGVGTFAYLMWPKPAGESKETLKRVREGKEPLFVPPGGPVEYDPLTQRLRPTRPRPPTLAEQWGRDAREHGTHHRWGHAHEAPLSTEPFILGSASGSSEKAIHVNLNVDGRKLAGIVLDRAGRVLGLPPSGSSSSDPRLAPLYPGLQV